jgi:RES domain-containing protein
MKMRANRAYPKFRRRLEEQTAVFRSWQGTAYRVTTLDYPKTILSGQGSFLFGGRWNAPDSFRAVYGSTTDTVAVAESRANSEYAGIPYPFRMPRLLVAIEFNLEKVLDLTTVRTRDALEINCDEFAREDWRKIQSEGSESLTQALGRAAFETGIAAILAASARVGGGINIVYFPKNKGRADQAAVCESEKLDRIQEVRE